MRSPRIEVLEVFDVRLLAVFEARVKMLKSFGWFKFVESGLVRTG